MGRITNRHRELRREQGPLRPEPDVGGALDKLGDQLPRTTARKVLDGYVVSALSRGRWERAWGALAESRDAGDLTSEQWDTLVAAAEAHHVPGPE